MRLSLLLLSALCVSCASLLKPSPEVMFQQHAVFVKAIPVPGEDENLVATGVNENQTAHRMLDLLSANGVELLQAKAQSGTIEERIIATRLYAWYVGTAAHAQHANCHLHASKEIIKLSTKCAGLVNENTMIELHRGLSSAQIPKDLRHLYYETDRFVLITIAARQRQAPAQ